MHQASSRTEHLKQEIESILPNNIALCVATPDMYHAILWEAEQDAVSTCTKKRREQFTAGRTAARKALKELGNSPAAIPIGKHRSPIWPYGTVGSISHCETACCAIAANARDFLSIGIDLEECDSVNSDLYKLLFTRNELIHLNHVARNIDTNLATLAFSAKEAFYKAAYPILRQFVDFLEVEVTFNAHHSNKGTFSVNPIAPRLAAKANCRTTGYWLASSEIVCTVSIWHH